MYISRVYLDRRRHTTAKALYNRNILHGALEQCFVGERQHPLWRIDEVGNNICLLVLSREAPNFASFVEQFGVSGMQAQTKSYDAFLEHGIMQGEIMRFRITVNPTIKKDGKRIPLNMNRTEKQQYCASDWLRDRLIKNGAELIRGDISNYRRNKINNGQKNITLVSADFDGYIKIIDREKFVLALANGIGHGKAYGCGMISVMR